MSEKSNKYKDYRMPLHITSAAVEDFEVLRQYYKLVLLSSKSSEIIINHTVFTFSGQCAVFLNQKDCINKINGEATLIYFAPYLVNRNFIIEILDTQNEQLQQFDDFIYIQPFIRENNVPNFKKLTQYLFSKIQNLCRKTTDELKGQRDDYWPCRSKAYIIEIMFHLSLKNSDPNISEQEDIIDKILNYIHDNIAEEITITSLEKMFNVNRTSLVEKFYHATKTTPIKYINSCRIELASSILLNTAVPVNEICERVGINSTAYFSKIFKGMTGHSPTQFRRLQLHVKGCPK